LFGNGAFTTSCWILTMEQSSIAAERGGLFVQLILVVAKDIFVWTLGATARCELL